MSSPAPRILLDISRLLWRLGPPTGIERVELAYAQHFLATAFDRLRFVAFAPPGQIVRLPKARASNFINTTAECWAANEPPVRKRRARIARRLRLARFIDAGNIARQTVPSVHFLVSHHHLGRPAMIGRFNTRMNAKFVCMVHDLIPYLYPEYARPEHATRHAHRMATAAQLADAVIFNSAATRGDFAPFLERAGRAPAMLVAPLGVNIAATDAVQSEAPYFVCVGTIEPRKNHLLLLNLWRELAAGAGAEVPRLILVGRRGWENENVLDMIERCGAIANIIEERNVLSDAELAHLVKGARALLLPSFAEGFGLPLAEAFACGTPVLCSDLPALRELGGNVPEYFDPLDGAAWRAAVLDYAKEASTRRKAQLNRLAKWRAPSWTAHFTAVDNLIGEICPAENAAPA